MRNHRQRCAMALVAMLVVLAAWTSDRGRSASSNVVGPHVSAPSTRESVMPDVAPARIRIDLGHDGPRLELLPIALLSGCAMAAVSSFRSDRRQSAASTLPGRFVVAPASGRAPPVALLAS